MVTTRYGNRWMDVAGGNQSLYFTASSNRITGGSYDNAGNLLSDGDGQRLRKLLGENLRFIYGIAGELITEFNGTSGALTKEYIYGANGLAATIEPSALNSNGTRYATPDHLGSPRVITNSSAGVVSRHDYMPFGEELGVGVGGRTAGMGFGVADGVRQKFTSYERDTESTLDFAGARYYSANQGRFTSVDPLMASASPADPQTFNRYTYVSNAPLTMIDPTGMFGICPGGGQIGMGGVPLGTFSLDNDTGTDTTQRPRRVTPPQPQQQPQQPVNTPPTIDVRQDPLITAAIDSITANGFPLASGERPELTSVIVVQGQTTTVTNTSIIDAYGNVSPPFTGTISPIAYIPLDQACNIIPQGNGTLVSERVTTLRGTNPTTSGTTYAPPNGVFIDLQTISPSVGRVEIRQDVRVSQGRNQITFGPNEVIKDPTAGTINFKLGPQVNRKIP